MKTYQHPLAHLYERPKKILDFRSGSLFQSIVTASTIGAVVALAGLGLNTLRSHGNHSWYVSPTGTAALELVVVAVLLTLVIEGRRKRAIRRTLELAFLNHHIRNAITQVNLAQYVDDPQKKHRLIHQGVDRISEALFRIANSVDLTGLSLEVDLQGGELAHAGEAREQRDQQKAG